MIQNNFYFLRHFCNSVKRKLLNVGDNVSVCKQITSKDVEEFCKLSGDTNPIHLKSSSNDTIVHGALLNGLVSGVIGTMLPGPGTLVVSQNLNYPNKCFVDETIKITVKLVDVRKIINVEFSCEVEDKKKVVLFGNAKVVLSTLLNS